MIPRDGTEKREQWQYRKKERNHLYDLKLLLPDCDK